ncbi:MFS transporter [Rhodococcus opacus]|uniref:MFS transporter n=1 Tax=Rhodococcus opacus TaxID=37919 RepID=UPI00247547C8|nr:MFS transporter [Rhodococcus opacus]MDH6293194.1 MHS family proline/betaine transporter-like MFS transporter [Rhodococcus opacus]
MSTVAVHAPTKSQRAKAITAGALGNFIEWFDFVAYGALATIIAPRFFPSADSSASLLATFGAFAVALLFRPVGGVLFGIVADRYGRRVSLSTSVLLMSAATAGIGLLPTADVIGTWAAVFMVLMRSVQGLAVGSEWSSSAIYLAEYGSARPRAMWATFTTVGSFAGSATGVAFVAALTNVLGDEVMQAWGWRIPFILALPLGLVGLYMRIRLQDTPDYVAMKENNDIEPAPLRAALRGYWREMLVIFGGALTSAAVAFIVVSYFVTYMTGVVGVSRSTALLTNTIAIFLAVPATILSGAIADRIGRKPVFFSLMIAAAALALPMFILIESGKFWSMLIGQAILAMTVAGMAAPLAVMCVELFPPNIRAAASGAAYSLGTSITGGLSPLVAVWLVSVTGSALAPSYYIIGVIVIGAFLTITFLGQVKARNNASERDLSKCDPDLVQVRS